MKLPVQAQPVTRKVGSVTALNRSMFPSQDCEEVCFRKCEHLILGCAAREGDCGASECLSNCKKIKCP
jgi:hypothetical protein